LTAAASGLDRDSVANVSGVVALDKAQLDERVGKVSARKLERVLAGVDVVLGR
jgi:mRNA-degrading endonuclease toxin of MazEF toxin-antitoxin module